VAAAAGATFLETCRRTYGSPRERSANFQRTTALATNPTLWHTSAGRQQHMGGPQLTQPGTVRVLGPVVIHGPIGASVVRGRQPAAVTAFVALAGRPVTRDELAELLWGEQLSIHWPSALRGVLSKVRSSFVLAGFPAAAVRSDDTVVRFGIADLRTDLELIEDLVDHDDACDLASSMAALARPFLPHDDSNWGRQVRERIHRTTRSVSLRYARELSESGRIDQAVSVLRSATALDPLDEAAHHLLIETLVRAGRRADASETLESLTTSLAYEFGVAPLPATAELLRRTAEMPSIRPAIQRARAAIHPHSDEPFVGRRPELDTLQRVWGEVVASGRPQLVLIEGQAGIGKTRLVDRFYNERVDEVTSIMWGRNRDANDRAFGALAEAVQRLVDDEPDMIDLLGDRARGLWPLLPRLAMADADRDDQSIRAVMIEGLRALLTERTSGPTIWFVDDLQWASPDVISIMESVVDGLQVPVLVIVTTRSVPADIAARLGSLQRVLPTTPIKLAALSVDEVAELLDDQRLAPALQARTGGLAFFASEIARQARLAEGQFDAGAVPDTIADWVSRRVESLTSQEASLIRVASVIGQEVDLEVLAHCSSTDPADVAPTADVLVANGLLTFDRSGSLQFAHAITRDVIYDGIGAAARMRLHRQIADTIADLLQVGDDLNHALLAHHYDLAGRDAATLAWTHHMKAARVASRSGAWAAAANSYQHAIDRATNQRRRAQAIVGAGRAHLAQGTLEQARVLLFEAIELAEDHDLPTIQAAAALALVGRAGRGAIVDTNHGDQDRLLRSALAALERTAVDSTARGIELWADLERELATVLLLRGPADERSRLFHSSLARARSIEPARPRAVARALLGVRYAKLDPSLLESRIVDSREVLKMSARDVGSEVRLAAFCYLHEDLLRLGQWGEAESVLAQAERLAERFPHSYWTWAVRTWRALSFVNAGNLDAAEAGALEAAATRPEIAEAEACLAVNLTNIRLHQGRAGEMIPMLTAASAGHPEIPTYRAVLALCAAESGDVPLASDLLATFSAEGFTNLPDDPNRFLGLAALAHVAASTEDAAACELLARLLEPYLDQWVVLQCYGGGGAGWGPANHALARLNTVLGKHDEARSLYDDARRLAADSPLTLVRLDRDQARDRRKWSPAMT